MKGSKSSSLTCTKLTILTVSAVLIQIIGLSLFLMGFFPVKSTLSGKRYAPFLTSPRFKTSSCIFHPLCHKGPTFYFFFFTFLYHISVGWRVFIHLGLIQYAKIMYQLCLLVGFLNYIRWPFCSLLCLSLSLLKNFPHLMFVCFFFLPF